MADNFISLLKIYIICVIYTSMAHLEYLMEIIVNW